MHGHTFIFIAEQTFFLPDHKSSTSVPKQSTKRPSNPYLFWPLILEQCFLPIHEDNKFWCEISTVRWVPTFSNKDCKIADYKIVTACTKNRNLLNRNLIWSVRLWEGLKIWEDSGCGCLRRHMSFARGFTVLIWLGAHGSITIKYLSIKITLSDLFDQNSVWFIWSNFVWSNSVSFVWLNFVWLNSVWFVWPNFVNLNFVCLIKLCLNWSAEGNLVREIVTANTRVSLYLKCLCNKIFTLAKMSKFWNSFNCESSRANNQRKVCLFCDEVFHG